MSDVNREPVARVSASRPAAAGSSQTSHSCRAAARVALITCADLRAARAHGRSAQLLDFLQLFSKYEGMQGCRFGVGGAEREEIPFNSHKSSVERTDCGWQTFVRCCASWSCT